MDTVFASPGSESPAESNPLPLGTFQSAMPFDGICLAITVRDSDISVPAQWWEVGASGDCTTRTSDVVASTADLSDPPSLVVLIPLMDGGFRELSLRVIGIGVTGIRVAQAGESETLLGRVDDVSPTFAPIP